MFFLDRRSTCDADSFQASSQASDFGAFNPVKTPSTCAGELHHDASIFTATPPQIPLINPITIQEPCKSYSKFFNAKDVVP